MNEPPTRALSPPLLPSLSGNRVWVTRPTTQHRPTTLQSPESEFASARLSLVRALPWIGVGRVGASLASSPKPLGPKSSAGPESQCLGCVPRFLCRRVYSHGPTPYRATPARLAVVMADPARRRATYSDLHGVSDHLVAEIVGGELVTSPRPAPRHARAASSLGGELYGPFDRGRGGPGGWIILDEPELHLTGDACGRPRPNAPTRFCNSSTSDR